MTPSNMRFVPNPEFGNELKRELDAKAQRVVDDVTARFRVDTTVGVQEQLERGLSEQGINLPETTLAEWAGVITNGDNLKVDIHIV